MRHVYSPELLNYDNIALSSPYWNYVVVPLIINIVVSNQTKVYLPPKEFIIKKDKSMYESPMCTSNESSDDSWLTEERSIFANLDLAIIIIAVMLFFGIWALGVSPFENPLLFLMTVIVFLIVITIRYGVAKALFGGLRK
ncbi:MAG: hypothetical protein ACFFFO_12240 [Candidatus Thorarchaeota archaeon]